MRKIKVCHLTTAHDPFDDRIFYKECKSLLKAGYEVTLIAQHEQDDIVDGIKIVGLQKAKNRIHRIILINMILLYRAVVQRADIYHFHDPELLPIGVLLKLLTFKIVIYDAHEDYANKMLSKHWIRRELRLPISYMVRLAEKVSCLFFNYIFTADSHTKLKFDPSKTEVLANVPPLDFIKEGGARDTNKSILTLIYTGGISEDRGIYVMLEAMNYLKDKEIKLNLLGDIHNGDLIELFSSYKNVTYFGSRPWPEVINYLLEADIGLVLLQPVPAYLYCPGENIIKLFEYMSAGLCVIISDFPKLRELITDINCGVPVNPTDPIKVAETINFLADHPDLRKRMGRNGKKAVLDTYNWDKESRKLIRIYSSLTGNTL